MANSGSSADGAPSQETQPVRSFKAPATSVTLETVGKHAGVSRSTVSRVINNAPGVSPDAAAAVYKAIEDLGYVTNQYAKSLATKRASTVTVLVPEDMSRFFGDPFFGSILTGIESEIEKTDLILNMIVASKSSLEKTIHYLAGGQTSGLLVLSHHTSDQLIAALEPRLPIVYGGLPIGDPSNKSFVDIDNVEGGRKAAKYLVERGCQRIAIITGPRDMPAAVDRESGFLEVVEKAQRTGPIESGDYSNESGRKAMGRLLQSGRSFDGVFVGNDLMARGAVRMLIEAGVRVPQDVAVVGFDDSQAATNDVPHLTTIHQDSVLQGQWMARLLLEQLESPQPPRSVILPTHLVVRDST